MKARLLPLLAVVVTGLLLAAPRPAAQVIPSGSVPQGVVAGAAETAPALRTGAPLSDGATTTAPGAPLPSQKLGDYSSAQNPELTPEPTPKPICVLCGKPNRNGIGGWASFYDDGPGIYVALPGWTRDSPIRTVVVCANVGLWRCATANVWTSCGCHTDTDHPKIVDLSPDLMALITGWDRATMTNRGVVRVTLQLIGGTP